MSILRRLKMPRLKATVKGDWVRCPECGYTYEIALDNQRAYCTGERTPATVPHKKHVRMR